MAVDVESCVAVDVEGGLAGVVEGGPANDLEDDVEDGIEGVLKGGFDVVAGGAEGSFTAKSCSSNKSPFLVNMKTVAL